MYLCFAEKFRCVSVHIRKVGNGLGTVDRQNTLIGALKRDLFVLRVLTRVRTHTCSMTFV